MFETLSFFGIFILTQFVKKYIKPKFGATGIHIFVFIVAIAVISLKGLATTYPPFGEVLGLAGTYLISSLALYKILVKPIADGLSSNVKISEL